MFSNKIIIILFLTQLVYSFKPRDFCFVNPNKCSCQHFCLKQCGQNLCSTNDQSCENFNKWSSLMVKYDKNKNGTGIYHQFVQEIKECKKESFVSLKSDVCSLGEKCNNKRLKRKNVCRCPNKKLSYYCGNNYCASSKNTCAIIFQNDSDNFNLKEINLCKII
jgi:hypothetical protein